MGNNRKKEILGKLNNSTQIKSKNRKEQLKILKEIEEEASINTQNLSKELKILSMEEVENIFIGHLPINHSLF